MEAEELQATARMARLSLSPAEEERLRGAVERMLVYCSHMASLPVDDLEPTTHALLSKNRLRADEGPAEQAAGVPAAAGPAAAAPTPVRLADALLANAPEREDRFILIPNVL
ncbi:MAG: Asp-tRNA(Asn)/Glu-tRNA(Gln) amidotransferase subunit GatC [Spirochaetes bacterium]|nr:Asp-tRNA(Asn)/Glu-tRNA(Gln) amidotransferase subunit GatC [Spirochaetota bacterium]